jgi:hypothetical protein
MLDGRVWIAGGSNGAADLSSTEIFDPANGTLQAAAPMTMPRQGHLAFRLPNNNQILLAGGTSDGKAVAAADLYTPWTGTLTAVESLSTPRGLASGAALPLRGSVLIAGGNNGARASASAEAFSFATFATDQSDYAPDSTMTITGAGLQPGETVRLLIHRVPGQESDVTISAVADANGNISTSQFKTGPSDRGNRFNVTATGLRSGQQGQITAKLAGPHIALNKSANPTTYSSVGTVTTYTYRILNSGDVTWLARTRSATTSWGRYRAAPDCYPRMQSLSARQLTPSPKTI